MRRRIYLLMTAVSAIGLWCACGGDARLAGKKLRNPTVGTVSHYGLTLDKNATPEQVAFVALRAIREDALAKDAAEREAALDKQFDVCAAGALSVKNRTSLPDAEFIHSVVNHWTPTVAFYANDLATEWEKASKRLVRRDPAPSKDSKEAKDDPKECEVHLQVADPSGDAKASVVVVVWMALDNGYWRVTHLGFDPTRRTLSTS